MTLDQLVQVVKVSFPQVYLARHAALLRTSRDERVAIVTGMTRLAEACRPLADAEAAA
jgi:hypothetical protein